MTALFALFGLLVTSLGLLIGASPLPKGREALSFAMAVLVWLFLCLSLSQFFGRRLARPVLELSTWAGSMQSELPARALARNDEIGSLSRALESMHEEIAKERRALEDRARVLEAMNRIDRAVLSGSARPELFEAVLGAVLDYEPSILAAIVMRDPEGGGFTIVAAKQGRGSQGGRDSAGGFIPDATLPDSVLIRYADSYELPISELGQEIVDLVSPLGGAELSLANLPFHVPGFYSGSLILLRREKRAALEDLKLLADQAGVALKDIEAREEGQGAWLGVVRSLVRAIDAKSAWTRGHSERVAALSTAVGRCLCMDTKELAWLEMAAVLHDVGKIGVPEAILDKPGRLDAGEIAAVQRHTIVGAGIVEDLPSSSPVREAILYHHERWDGSGYPTGLSGEDIPLAARIIALADVYDAITDDRPYRKGMGLPEARDFLIQGAGNLFDARLVRLFLETIAAPEAKVSETPALEASDQETAIASSELVDCP